MRESEWFSDPSPAVVEARREFGTRDLAWAIQECEAELAADFSRLRKVRNLAATVALEAMNGWPKSKCLKYMQARLRSTALGIPFDANDLALADEIDRHALDGPGRFALYREGNAREARSFDRRAFRTRVELELRPLLGSPLKHGSVSRYHAYVEGSTIRTVVDFGGRGRKVTYWHQVFGGHRTQNLVSETTGTELARSWISLAEWLGVGETSWMFLTDEDAEPIATLLREHCAHFVEASHALLKGVAIHALH